MPLFPQRCESQPSVAPPWPGRPKRCSASNLGPLGSIRHPSTSPLSDCPNAQTCPRPTLETARPMPDGSSSPQNASLAWYTSHRLDPDSHAPCDSDSSQESARSGPRKLRRLMGTGRSDLSLKTRKVDRVVSQTHEKSKQIGLLPQRQRLE